MTYLVMSIYVTGCYMFIYNLHFYDPIYYVLLVVDSDVSVLPIVGRPATIK